MTQITCGAEAANGNRMKNIQVIDGAENCVYDIFQATEDEFRLIFKGNSDVAFIDEVEVGEETFKNIWNRRIKKSEANSIHGILFYELENKKKYYPTRRDEEAKNPDGSRLR